MKLWLAQRFGRTKMPDIATQGQSSAKPMSASLEHIVRNRVRMFLRHTWLVTILGTIVLAGGVWEVFYLMTAPTVMRIAAGPSGSANTDLVHVLTQKLADDRDKVRLQLVGTGGPKGSAEALRDDKADLAILPSTVGNSPDWPVVAIMRQNVMALIVPAPAVAPTKKEASAFEKKEAGTPEKKENAGKEAKAAKSTAAAKTVQNAKHGKGAKSAKTAKGDKTAKSAKSEEAVTDDNSSDDADNAKADASAPEKLDKVAKLIGHRVGIVTGSVATRDLLDVVLKHYGVAADQVQVSLIDPKNLADAVKGDQIDAIFVAGSATGQAISDAVVAASRNGQAPSFVPIDQAEGIAKRIPAFDSADIDSGTFGGNPPMPDDKLTTLSFPEYLVARKSFSHEAIGTLAKLIYSSRLALAAGMPGEIKIEAPSTDKDAAVLVHPGALAYLNDDQKSFFDKYGDDIFYGLLIFPIFGSAIAGVASYFHNNGRTRRLRLLQRLLDLVRKAHAAPSLEALDQLQIDVDNLVVALIHQTEHEEYDQSVQMSFSLALDQVRFAIAARRAILLGGTESKTGTKAAAA
jgi:TRAP-type uncharacterized transport system substrate-binding protein